MQIVVGYVDRAVGRVALQAAVAEARLRGARLHVVHAARVAVRGQPPEHIARMHHHLEQLGRGLASDGLDARTDVLLSPREPAEAILAEVQRLSAGMLVVGARRRSAVGKLVLGSTVQHLLLRAPCPVLVVKLPPGDGDDRR